MITIYEECVCHDSKGTFTIGKRPIGSVSTREDAAEFLKRETQKVETHTRDGVEITLIHQPCSYSDAEVEREIASGSVLFSQSCTGVDRRGIRPAELSGRAIKRMSLE